MRVSVTCECGNRFEAKVARDSATARCPDCRESVLVPTAGKARRKQAEAAVATPAKALLVIGGVTLLIGAGLFLFGGFMLVKGGVKAGPAETETARKNKNMFAPDAAEQEQRAQRERAIADRNKDRLADSGLFVIGEGILVIAFASALMKGALAMRDLGAFHWAVVGCVLGMLALFPLGAAVGVWALVVIMKPEIKSKFGKKREAE